MPIQSNDIEKLREKNPPRLGFQRVIYDAIGEKEARLEYVPAKVIGATNGVQSEEDAANWILQRTKQVACDIVFL